MHNSRNHGAARPLLALILLIFSPAAFAAPEPNAVLEVTGEGLTYLDVEFRSREGKELERYQFKANEDGLVVDGVALPAEGGGDYEITAFDRDGIATYSGKGPIPPLLQGDRPLQLVLTPTDKEDDHKGGRDGIIVTLSTERLVLEAKPLEEPNTFAVHLQAFDPRGNAMKFDPNDIRWGLTDPTHFELLPKELAVIVRPVETFPRPNGERCDVPPKVVLCIPNGNCRVIKVCPEPWITISAGGAHTCALMKSGVAYCWGANDQNELSARTTEHCGFSFTGKCSTRPRAVECPANSPCYFTQIAAGGSLTVAIDMHGDAWWWGRNTPGHHKITANGKPLKFEKVTAGENHGCGLTAGGEIWCWGGNLFGETGAPLPMTEVLDFAPFRVLPYVKFSKVVAGGEHTCALFSSGNTVMCWGRDDSNQTTGPDSSPHPSSTGPFHFQHFGGLTPILDVAVSVRGSCVTLGNSNGVSCWGNLTSPGVNLFGTPEELTAGGMHVCAVSAQQASCMGSNFLGQLGINSLVDQASPVPVNGPPTQFATISAGNGHTCGLTPKGEAYCWGKALDGQVGNGTSNLGVLLPVKVTIP